MIWIPPWQRSRSAEKSVFMEENCVKRKFVNRSIHKKSEKGLLLSERAVTESACRASGRAAERHGTSMKQEETKQGNQQKQEYEQYVKSVTPTHNLWAQMGKAFLTGGIICCIGQGILNYTGNVLGMVPRRQAAGVP